MSISISVSRPLGDANVVFSGCESTVQAAIQTARQLVNLLDTAISPKKISKKVEVDSL